MATVYRTVPSFRGPAPLQAPKPLISQRGFPSVSCRPGAPKTLRLRSSLLRVSSPRSPRRFLTHHLPFASHGEATETEQVRASETQDNPDGAINGEKTVTDSETSDTEELPASAIIASLQSYKEALKCNDDSKLAEIEAFIKSVEHEKVELEKKFTALSEELSYEKDRILRISADFDNFRKRTQREKLSLVTNAQGEIVENLLPVLDNFERAKSQIKVETTGEEKINNSYQSIYKQFVEILGSIGVVSVETIGKPFDPLVHEAIMHEESTEFEEGIVIEEFRKGSKLGDRLLRPSMVKVSAGPGPVKAEPVGKSEEIETAAEIQEEEAGASEGSKQDVAEAEAEA